MKYLVFDNGQFNEFNSWSDAEYFMLDKPNAKCRKITSKKVEEEFKEFCKNAKEYKPKIYVVISDNEIKRFEKWKEAKEYIDRNPGAKYKSFEKEEDAQEFANLNVHANMVSDDVLTFLINQTGNAKLVKNNEVLWQKDFSEIKNQIERELQAILAAIDKSIELSEEQILIKCNNLGAEMWANGTWNANKDYSKAYKKKIEEFRKKINIDFKTQK